MKTIYTLLLTLIAFSNYAQEQTHIFQDWEAEIGDNQNVLHKTIVKTDANNNVYRIGTILNTAGNYDLSITKYNSRGNIAWNNIYDGGANDAATCMFVDEEANVYIAGFTQTTSNDAILIKYDVNGSQKWIRTWNNPTADVDDVITSITLTSTTHTIVGTGLGFGTPAVTIVIDSSKIFLSGYSLDSTNTSNILALAYNDDGTLLWQNTYDYNHLNDVGTKIFFIGAKLNLAGVVQESSVSTFTQHLV
jgi:hypothetical protein